MTAGLMQGKRGLVMGVANDHSIAWGIARRQRSGPQTRRGAQPINFVWVIWVCGGGGPRRFAP
jgi:hypothetical protein